MIQVVKRNGKKEEFEIEKIHKVINWALTGLTDVSLSEIEINAKLNITDGISTEQIHSVLVDSASNLISEEHPDYQYAASRLLSFQLRKKIWGGIAPPTLLKLIKDNIEKGYYDKNILKWYTEEQINELDQHIDHDRDLNYTYCSVKQLCDKYLVKNQFTNEMFETPQFRYMIVALTVFNKYNQDPSKNALDYVKRIYDCFSKFKINLATPQLAGLGTINNSSASCLLIEQLDDKESINATNYAVAKATCMGYGIGVNFGRMRGIKSPVRNGTILHPGVVPFLKITEANTKAWQKNGVRGGSATVNFPIWHSEIETVVQLKNSTTGTHDSRVFNLDYVIGISKLFYERFIKNEDITLFSPHDVPGLYDAFGLDGFDELYKQYELDDTIKSKKTVKARELISLLVKERLESGRIYIINIDNVNKYGSWLDKINMTNLCVEVTQAIEPLRAIADELSEIGVCVLSAINWLEIESEEDLEIVCDLIVRMLDEIIDHQDYFDVSAQNFCQNKRSLGVGITNLAAFLAKNKLFYSDKKALEVVDEWMEKQQYYLIKASINLAKEDGPCKKFHTSKYSKGWLPIDKTFKESLVIRNPSMDWEKIREDLIKYGMKHCTLTCQMPVESSSACQNATNGVEPARSLKSYKSSKKASVPFLVPNIKSNAYWYELAFDMPDNTGYMNICCVIQRWMDMAMSVNQYFCPSHYPDKKIPYSQIIKEMLHFYKIGGKCIYYCNTNDNNDHQLENKACASGACTL